MSVTHSARSQKSPEKLEHLWNHKNMIETGVVRANECYSLRQVSRHNKDIFFDFLQYKGMLCVFIRIASSRRF